MQRSAQVSCCERWQGNKPVLTTSGLARRAQTPDCARRFTSPHASSRRSTLLLLPILQLTLASSTAASDAPASTPAGAGGAPGGLIEELLKKSQANKQMNDKSRLDSYYRRNLKEYFETEMRDPRNAAKKGLSPETIRSMQQYLEKNR